MARISIKINYSFYDIEDYIATNSGYAAYSGGGAGIMRYYDYKINLPEVYRYGIDIGLGGHLLDVLSIYLSYSWQDFENQGNQPAGETELDQRAKHRVSAGLSYQLFPTTLMLDYNYQSKEVIEVSEEVAEDVWISVRLKSRPTTRWISVSSRCFSKPRTAPEGGVEPLCPEPVR